VSVEHIRPNPYQPRRHFDQASLEELADSIRTQGVLQPILLRRSDSAFELIAGERRLRAALLAGLRTVPAIVREVNEQKALELAIIENLQREDLNPIEQARAFAQLSDEFQLTQEQIALRTGKDRATVANFVRLLKLDEAVQAMVEAGSLSMGHARALIPLDLGLQRNLAQRVVENGWSVRNVEEFISRTARPQPVKKVEERDPNVRAAEEQLARSLGAKVRIRDRKNRGTIEIEYSSIDEFQRIYELFVPTA
jgi:ParB family chromosome partitioning protein